jgi:hypothetical protein
LNTTENERAVDVFIRSNSLQIGWDSSSTHRELELNAFPTSGYITSHGSNGSQPIIDMHLVPDLWRDTRRCDFERLDHRHEVKNSVPDFERGRVCEA